MKLEDANICFDHCITGGSKFLWTCFGPNARYLDYESEHADASVIFDSVTQVVYIAEINAKRSEHLYKWVNPAYESVHTKECNSRGHAPEDAWDDYRYVMLETANDFFEKASAIFNGKPFDNRVEMPLDLDHESIVALALEAHRRDITLNQMVELILEWVLEESRSITKGDTK